MKIIQVGLYPPPYGGVSIHLSRLMEQLNDHGRDALLIDLSACKKSVSRVKTLPWWRALLFLFFTTRSIVHGHNYSIRNLFFYWTLHFRHRVILSFHNERHVDVLFARRTSFSGKIILCILRKIDGVVVDNKRSLDVARQCLGPSFNLRLIPEFIAPRAVPDVEDPQIVEMRKRYSFLLASNAFMISFYNGEDLYGLDILIDTISRLWHDDRLDVGMVVLLPTIGNETYYQQLCDRLRCQQIADRFCFIREPLKEASSLWKISDLVVRATNTDGNSLTVWEALGQGTPVIASDCVERPNECVLFRTRDVEDLRRAIKRVLCDVDTYRRRLRCQPKNDHVMAFMKLYDTLEDGEAE